MTGFTMHVPMRLRSGSKSGYVSGRIKRRGTWLTLLLVVPALLLFPAAQLSAQSASSVTLIRATRLLDPRTGNVLTPATVLVEADKIKQVGTDLAAPPGARVIDLGTATLLPGMIDGHTHLFLDIVVASEQEQDRHFNGLFAPAMVMAI